MEDQAGALQSMLASGFLAVWAVAWLAVAAVICWLLYSALERVPAEHRKQTPGLVWLLLIPCFGAIWSFFVFPRISQSYKSYFASAGRTDTGDSGEAIAWALCVAWVACLVPLLNLLALPVTLVLLIIYLVKIMGLKGQIPA